ncbi:D-alanyl-D-alanine carboxypeptidase/D-alanyl-D-alanine endopeptidase [Conexibacter woesei]|uniref:D-alanyl-D-alanine carboxypeptidase/D-alanyl-D-alanine endopeptidase n=1 Tax=Conexibacter woesei TaxID=191495 RepID=UPI00031EC79F|nr:D-alanyl-D-alanine carboxypeptidase/D-alanyl-D-alanine-endopeptidase [Conexibacter woesei]
MSALGAAGLLAGSATAARPSASGKATGADKVAKIIARIEAKPRYRHADWGFQILDQRTGDVLGAQNAQKMFDPGSTMKLYSVSTALSRYGTNYRFRTPVYRQGTVSGGTLGGSLVLVGSGDLTLGLRAEPGGRLAYANLPAVDHSYADQLPGAVLPKGDPMAGLDELARDVRASGITRVSGDVVVDDRLFAPYDGFPDGLISPIWVNENLVDLLVKPGAVGQPASIDQRPLTASYTVDNRVVTVRAGKPTTLNVSEPTPGTIEVTGQIAAGSGPTLKVWEVDDPAAFARTAFIAALQRAGVTVTATATGPNPATLLPPKGSYQAADRVGEHVSSTLSQYAKLILKVSHNRGADLMTCLAAVRRGSTDCEDGLTSEVQTASGLGVPYAGVIPMDGAGSDDQGRTTPAALATLLRHVVRAPYGRAFVDALPILGRDGTLANVESRSPAAGRSQMKTGNRVVSNAAGQIIVLGNSLAGYAETKSGRRVVFMIAVGNVPTRTAAGFFRVVDDQAAMVVAIQQNL